MSRYLVFYCIQADREVRWVSLTAQDDEEMRAKLPDGAEPNLFAKREITPEATP